MAIPGKTFLCLALFAAAPALAQDAGDDGGLPGLPDGSVGQGGADRDNQEGEDVTGRVPLNCRATVDCERNFECQDTRCVYVGPRVASCGCQGAPGSALLTLGLTVVGLRLRRRP